jgi:hypothetical protein
MLPRLVESVGSIRGLAGHFNISLGLEYLADASTHTFVVIYEQHAKGGLFHRLSRRNSSKPYRSNC